MYIRQVAILNSKIMKYIYVHIHYNESQNSNSYNKSLTL
jgi:hypothetical protein